jgi:hypothetical protein
MKYMILVVVPEAWVQFPLATGGIDRMFRVERLATPSLEVAVGGKVVGVLEIVDEPLSRIDRVDVEAAGCD